MRRRILALSILAICLVGIAAASYVYLGQPSTTNGNPSMTVIHIPRNSGTPPPGWNVTFFQQNFLTGNYPYPVKLVVVVGVNNTIEWVNDDTEAHTVTALQAPTGAVKFNSGLILEGKTFSSELDTPGVYRYTCAWHNWLAGQITVNPA